MEFEMIENEVIPIYSKNGEEKYVSARELHEALGSKRQFANWIKQRIDKYGFIENEDFIPFNIFVKGDENGYGNRKLNEYYLTLDTAKEIAMIENNNNGKKIRKYFIEVEKRYRQIIQNPNNIFDFMRLALDQIEINENKINKVEEITMQNQLEIENLKQYTTNEIKEIKSKIDVIIKKEYCLASDIAEQIGLFSENNLPHANLVGAIARQLGYKNTYKHYYEDENIAIVPDISKGRNFWQVYYKEKAVKEIINWFAENKSKMKYKIIYEKNTPNGQKGEVREKGYKIDGVCYKIKL